MTDEHTEITPAGDGHVSEDVIETANVIDVAAEEETPPAEMELPEDPAEAVAVLQESLAARQADARRYLDDYQRMAAEFDNYRKRAQRDQAELVARASERVVTNLLPVLDSLDAAMAVEPDGETSEKLIDGMRGTREQLLTVLRAEGVEPIESLGTEFDPGHHEAVQMAAGSGTMIVTAELRRGYRFRDRVLRPALVAVGYEGAGAN